MQYVTWKRATKYLVPEPVRAATLQAAMNTPQPQPASAESQSPTPSKTSSRLDKLITKFNQFLSGLGGGSTGGTGTSNFTDGFGGGLGDVTVRDNSRPEDSKFILYAVIAAAVALGVVAWMKYRRRK